jgi:D-amino-acid dehydrogenase
MAHVLIIGGGVVGICCALELQNDGHIVTIIDRDAPGEGACAASCGSIAVSEVIPLSRPGTLMRAPGWLLDPTGPLTLRASSALSMLPWFLRFASNSRLSRIKAISSEISALTSSALADTQSLLKRYQLSELLRDAPVLELYDNHEDLQRERVFHDIRRDLGFQIDEISGNEATEMEPSIAGDFACAAVFRDWRSIVDGKRFVVELHKAFVERGGSIEHAEVSRLIKEGDNVGAVQTTESRYFKADQIVIAAGAWSKKLAASIGLSLQIEGVIGYQMTLESPGVEVNHGLVYAAGGFGVTPYESGLAIGGSIEFAGLNATPNWKRADVLVEKARRVLPGLRTDNAKKRIGRRPLTPDTKPIIGRAPRIKNVLIATGHGQLGLTLGATTALLVSDLVANRQPRIDLAAYRPDRF